MVKNEEKPWGFFFLFSSTLVDEKSASVRKHTTRKISWIGENHLNQADQVRHHLRWLLSLSLSPTAGPLGQRPDRSRSHELFSSHIFIRLSSVRLFSYCFHHLSQTTPAHNTGALYESTEGASDGSGTSKGRIFQSQHTGRGSYRITMKFNMWLTFSSLHTRSH